MQPHPPEAKTQSAPVRSQFTAIVAANVPLCREHFKLILRLDSFPPTEPGQFIHRSAPLPPRLLCLGLSGINRPSLS